MGAKVGCFGCNGDMCQATLCQEAADMKALPSDVKYNEDARSQVILQYFNHLHLLIKGLLLRST